MADNKHSSNLNDASLRKARRNANERISGKLRAYYNAVKEEGIPDRFLDLLERLDKAEQIAAGKSSKKDSG